VVSPLAFLLTASASLDIGDADDHAKGTGGLIMFGTMEPWGYGGYGQFHMVIWIILAIAAVAGVVWRLWLLRSGSS
jgi:phosphotransferase system  glucose/maltose/N-acetylglucosamine-specific IIC component